MSPARRVQLVLAAVVFSVLNIAAAQEPSSNSVSGLALQHRLLMRPDAHSFTGPGWDLLATRVAAARQVLVGEDHFTNEIPRLVDALAQVGRFDFFYIEVDPFTTGIIERELRAPDPARRAAFRQQYGDLLSFYALEPEYRLLEKWVGQGVSLLGSDQVLMYADRLLFAELLARNPTPAAAEIYQRVIERSQQAFARFLATPNEPDFSTFYFMTPQFIDDLDELAALELGEHEAEVIRAMRRSVSIYANQGHRERVQLLKHHLMQDHPRWLNARTLFKYGANHVLRGESFLTVHDIGTVVANLAEAAYQDSLHVMVMGASGAQGAPFRGFPPRTVDPQGFYLAHLAPFLALVEGADWLVFDLVPLRDAYERGTLAVEDRNLVRTLKGIDVLVIIPEVSAAQFPAPN